MVDERGAGRDDAEELAGYVEVWWGGVGDFLALLEQVPEEQWATPTDLPGWDVHACVAHIAHLEAVLAGRPEEPADVGEPAHVTGPMGFYTEVGVVNRRGATKDALLAQLREVTSERHAQLLADPPTDADARPAELFTGVPWSWRVLLRNRVLDVWMHEQDVRRAVGRPGGLDTPAADLTLQYLAEAFGYVLAKRAGAEPGTTAVLEVDGLAPYAFAVDERGRGVRLPQAPGTPDVVVRADRESFLRLAGGRCAPPAGGVEVVGDRELGERVLARMATTP